VWAVLIKETLFDLFFLVICGPKLVEGFELKQQKSSPTLTATKGAE